jgi:hypothetical protein
MRLATKQRAMAVSVAYQDADGKWYVNIDVFSEAGLFTFRITPIQGVRIAADLLSAWRPWETAQKNPSTDKPQALKNK